MTLFNNFIDSLKASYISIKNNQNTVLKSALALFLVNLIGILALSIIGTVLVFIVIGSMIGASEALESNTAIMTNIFLFIIIFLLVVLLIFALLPLSQITTIYGAITIHENKTFDTKELMSYIKTNYLKLLWGNILINIVLTVCLGILYIVGLIVIIPLAILTSGIAVVILFTYIGSMYSYWSLFAVKDDLSPFAALDKNINLGFNKTAVITCFSLAMISLNLASSTILGVFSLLMALLIIIFAPIISHLFIITSLEIAEDNKAVEE